MAIQSCVVCVDLQFSSEDELEEVTGMSEGEVDGISEPQMDDDSQQAAEAMMQLGNIAYCVPQDQGKLNTFGHRSSAIEPFT